jgi:hypothetical protein
LEDDMTDNFWADAEVISCYTRAQAIEDGVLVEVPGELARQAGFNRPVAMTAAAWADAVEWTDDTEAAKPTWTAQDETGRLWDVLTMAARKAPAGDQRLAFRVLRVPATGRGVRPRLTTLHLVAGTGDSGEPVLTVMLPADS